MAKLKDIMTYQGSKLLLWGSGIALFLILALGLLWAQPGSIIRAAESAVDETLNLTIGTLPEGKHVVLTFDVTIGSLPPDVTQISNQGVVSGTNFATVLTDDPALPGASDPTIIAANPNIISNPPVATFTFSKTVGIDGILPECTNQGTRKVPRNTTVVYCYTIHNTSTAEFVRHSLSDSHLGTLLNNSAITVAPGASFSHPITATLSVDTTNVATWTAATAADASTTAVDAVNQVVTTTVVSSATVIISSDSDDQDNDTIPDNTETAGDQDDDNIPNYLDPDSDGDGTPDDEEVGPDPNNPLDSDGDGIPDFLDPDTTPTALEPDTQPQQRSRLYLPNLGQ